MFTDFRPTWRRTKPPPGARVDPLHPLAPYSCYLLNEGAGRMVGESVLGGNSAAFGNAPTWNAATASGGYGYSLNFVAASSQDILSNQKRPPASLNNAPSTMVVLYRTTNAGTTNMVPFAHGRVASNTPFAIIRLNSGFSGKLEYTLRNDGATSQGPSLISAGFVDGKWHMVHAVNEGNGRTMRLYVDGVQRATAANTLGTAITLDTERIGAVAQTPGIQFFDGDISFVMTFARPLSPAEVWSHYQNPFQSFLPLRPLQPSLLPATFVIDRRTGNFRPASRIARGGL